MQHGKHLAVKNKPKMKALAQVSPVIKNTVLTVLLIGGFIWLIYYLGRRSWLKEQPKDVELPGDVQPVGQGSSFNPGAYTDALERDIYGKLSTRSSKPYNDVLALSNSQVVAIHNDWNKRYYHKHKETIYQALSREYTIWNLFWLNAAGALMARLASLNLK
jgi:hypothetical protein